LALQLLEVPVCDVRTVLPTGEVASDCPYESVKEFEFTTALPVERLSYFYNHFLGNPRPKGFEQVS
jgi:hypothetical protein